MKQKTLTDEELAEAFKGTDYGPSPDYHNIVKWGLLKIAAGYLTGYTTLTTLMELGLVTRSKKTLKNKLTKQGKYCLWEYFKKDYNG